MFDCRLWKNFNDVISFILQILKTAPILRPNGGFSTDLRNRLSTTTNVTPLFSAQIRPPAEKMRFSSFSPMISKDFSSVTNVP